MRDIVETVDAYRKAVQDALKAKLPFSSHEQLYKTFYPDWESLPAPAWLPGEAELKHSNLAKWMLEQGYKTPQTDYPAFHQWSVQHYPDFWQKMVGLLKLNFDAPPASLVDLSQGVEKPLWFPGAKLNITKSCFQASPTATAIVYQREGGKLEKVSYEALDKLSNRVANSLSHELKKGDRVAIVMPMTVEAVAIYLGIIKMGAVVVAIPDSFSSEELALRLRISQTKLIFCQDQILRDGKRLPLYQRVLEAQAPAAIVLPAEKELSLSLRETDRSWETFLSKEESFSPHSAEPQEAITLLFSSGTTGEPKIIPWSQTSPIKAAADAYLHHNLQEKDIFCWPSNLGWMMGPWLIFACLINNATMALYYGTPNTQSFGRFIEEADVSHLGIVPAIVKHWRNTACMEGLNWKKLKLFSSTGERSNAIDMLYLMVLASYRPVIEYCGGTEISGAYISGTVIQPAAPGAFTTPTLGLDFVLLNDEGKPADKGEVALIPPSLGLSTELLNKDHYQVYYEQMPTLADGRLLRRHGDEIERCANGYYRLLGRVDDTMKLSGIKISSAELENALNGIEALDETAAIAITPPDGGLTQLIIYAVPKPNTQPDLEDLKNRMQKEIKERLSPLFKVSAVVLISALPRTASNKVMRRILRDNYLKEQWRA